MNGETELYFHGMPGGAGELTLFGPISAPPHVMEREAHGDEACHRYFDRLAASVTARFPEGRLRLIGFSLGAVAALQVAARLGKRVSRLDLISAAAPLSTGDYLPRMAGQPVFRLARRSARGFRVLTKLQTLAMRFAPDLVYNALFATAQGGDIALRDGLGFRVAMHAMLRTSLATPAYTREIEFYIGDWSAVLAHVRQPVMLWHGRLDNWSPPDMADALARALPGCEIVWLEDASHYSTLKAFLERREGER